VASICELICRQFLPIQTDRPPLTLSYNRPPGLSGIEANKSTHIDLSTESAKSPSVNKVACSVDFAPSQVFKSWFTLNSGTAHGLAQSGRI
jgi:hypothetical protein